MATGSNTGNGKTNPFGNGSGGASGGTMKPNNFQANPGGSGGNRVPANPMNVSNPQRALNNERDLQRNPKDAAPGANTAAEAVVVPPSRANDVGVGTVGDGSKPYRV